MKQSIYAASAVQVYPIGKRLAIDERVFRYGYASGIIIPAWGVTNENTFEESGFSVYNQAVGDITVTLTCVAAGGVALNQFQGGYIVYWGIDTTRGHTMRVKSNTAALTTGDTFVVRLEHGLPGTMTAGVSVVTCHANSFSNLQSPAMGGGTPGYVSFVGIPLVDIPATQYGWIQTWGPCNTVGTAAFGANTHETKVVFNFNDGSTQLGNDLGDWPQAQLAGFMLPNPFWGGVGHNSVGGNFINLMIFP